MRAERSNFLERKVERLHDRKRDTLDTVTVDIAEGTLIEVEVALSLGLSAARRVTRWTPGLKPTIGHTEIISDA